MWGFVLWWKHHFLLQLRRALGVSWSNYRLQEETIRACGETLGESHRILGTGGLLRILLGAWCWAQILIAHDRAIVDRLVWQNLKHLSDPSEIASQVSTCLSMETKGRRTSRVNRKCGRFLIYHIYDIRWSCKAISYDPNVPNSELRPFTKTIADGGFAPVKGSVHLSKTSHGSAKPLPLWMWS